MDAESHSYFGLQPRGTVPPFWGSCSWMGIYQGPPRGALARLQQSLGAVGGSARHVADGLCTDGLLMAMADASLMRCRSVWCRPSAAGSRRPHGTASVTTTFIFCGGCRNPWCRMCLFAAAMACSRPQWQLRWLVRGRNGLSLQAPGPWPPGARDSGSESGSDMLWQTHLRRIPLPFWHSSFGTAPASAHTAP